MPSPQGRMFLLTVPVQDVDFLSDGYSLPETCVYLCGQKEQGKETGYVHWQAYAQFSTKKTCSAVRKMFGGRAHVELTRTRSAIEYCRKSDSRIGGT